MQGKRNDIPRVPAELKRIYDDFWNHEQFTRECLSIRDKRGKSVPFELQPAQRKLNDIFAECRRRKRPIRVIVLKARQVMISTAVAAQYFQRVAFVPGQAARIVAHNDDGVKLIFGYYHQLHESYTPFRNVIELTECVKDAEDKGILEYATGSKFMVQTANTVQGGRGASFRFLHLSEFAFWRDAPTLMTGLMQTVPDDPDTAVVIESTANGVGGEFHRLWQEACDPGNDSEWIPLFFAWWEHPEYEFELEDPVAFEASLRKEEQELRQKYNLRLGQLAWRRWAIANKCHKSVDRFKQEYPASPEEAFLFSGRPRFSHQQLSRMPVDKNPLIGDLQETIDGPKPVLHFMLDAEGRGKLAIWKKPQERKRYAIGIDVAEGIDIGEGVVGSIDPDYSAAVVLDADTGEQVARLRGRIEPSPFGEYVAVLGRWYNWAFLVPETNGPGLALLEELLRQNYPPSLIYHRRPTPDEYFSDQSNNVLSKLGWRTTTVNRIQLISELDAAIRKFEVIVRDPIVLSELQTFVYKANGRMEHAAGCHDDLVIAIALAWIGVKTPPPDRRVLELTSRYREAPKPASNPAVRVYGQRRLPDDGPKIRF